MRTIGWPVKKGLLLLAGRHAGRGACTLEALRHRFVLRIPETGEPGLIVLDHRDCPIAVQGKRREAMDEFACRVPPIPARSF